MEMKKGKHKRLQVRECDRIQKKQKKETKRTIVIERDRQQISGERKRKMMK